ncbi:hypothetical protein OG737_29735 [Streptomyces sp. NBC_00122]
MPGGAGHIFGLEFTDVRGGAEEKAEIEVLVGRLLLVGSASMGWPSMWRGVAVQGDDVGRDVGFLDELAAGGLEEGAVGRFEVAALNGAFTGRCRSRS